MLFIVNIIGAGLGPLIVGAVSDYLSPQFGDASIRYALVCSLAIGAVGTLVLLVAGRSLEADLQRARAAG